MKNRFWLILPLLAMLFVACDDEVSYSDMKDQEARAIKAFLRSEGINVITFSEFVANDSVTDVEKNEYVQLDGVYMQIVNNPKDDPGAHKIKEKQRMWIIARFYEYDIMDGDTITFRCSPCKEIHVTTYPTRGRSFYAPEGELLTEITYPLKGGEKYIRIECIDQEGNTAWTNPHFFD
jgi:hypothetical protein